MINRNLIIIIFILSLFISGCTTFIPDEESDQITLKYQSGEYILLQDIDRNGVIFPKNSVVKLIVVTGDDWVKIYAYNSKEELLASQRFLVLYRFDSEFPDQKFSQEYLDAELLKIVKPKGYSDKPKKEIKKKLK